MRALTQELGAGQPPMGPAGFAAAFGDRGNTGQVSDFGRTLETVAIGAKGGQQTRSQSKADTRKASSSFHTESHGLCRIVRPRKSYS